MNKLLIFALIFFVACMAQKKSNNGISLPSGIITDSIYKEMLKRGDTLTIAYRLGDTIFLPKK